MKPIIVHSMGRCGSRSIYQTLRHNGFDVRHCHYLTQRRREADKVGHAIIQLHEMDVYTIVPVRDPIARNLSAYFHNYAEHCVYDFVHLFPPGKYQEWFDAEVLGYWGVDVFGEPLVNGWRIFGSLLVIRMEDFDKFPEAFKALTGHAAPQLERDGVTRGDEYERVKALDIPQEYTEAIQKTQYYQQFYT